jgi:Flp pilus assembly protein TadG
MCSLWQFFKRFARCTSGTASIEAIIILPLALSLMAGGVEFGRIFSAYATADKAMRDAARYLARVPQSAICGWGFTNAQNLAVYGKLNPSLSDEPLISGWTPATVTRTSPASCAALSDPVVVELAADVPFSVNMLSVVGLPSSFTLHVTHQERHIGE